MMRRHAVLMSLGFSLILGVAAWAGTGVGEPGPGGEILEITAPDQVIRSCAIGVTALVTLPGAPDPILEATLVVTTIDGGVPVFEGPATIIDPGTGAIAWQLGREITEIWPAGGLEFEGVVLLGSGATLTAQTPSELVEMNALDIVIDGESVQNRDFEFPCSQSVPFDAQVEVIGGLLSPAGAFAPCGPVPTSVSFTSNTNGAGGPVLAISPAVGTQFTLSVVSFGQAVISFSSPLVPEPPLLINIVKQDGTCPLRVIRVLFNPKKGHTEDAMEIRIGGTDSASGADLVYPVSMNFPEWANSVKCPDDPNPLVRMGSDSKVCYALKQLGEVVLMAKFKGEEGRMYQVWADEKPEERAPHGKVESAPILDVIPPRTKSNEYADVDQVSGPLVIPLDNPCEWGDFKLDTDTLRTRMRARGVHKELITLRWYYRCTDDPPFPFRRVAGDTTFLVYVVLDTPQTPWRTGRPPRWTKEDPISFFKAPWTTALDLSCEIAARRSLIEPALEDLVKWIHVESGFKYETDAIAQERGAYRALWLEEHVRPPFHGVRSAMRVNLDFVERDSGWFTPPQQGFQVRTFNLAGYRLQARRPPVEFDAAAEFQLTEFLGSVAPTGSSNSAKRVSCSEVAGVMTFLASLLGSKHRPATVIAPLYTAGGPRDATELIGHPGRVNNPFWESGKPLGEFLEFPATLTLVGPLGIEDPPASSVSVSVSGRDVPPDPRPLLAEATEHPNKVPYTTHMMTVRQRDRTEGGGLVFYDAMVRLGPGTTNRYLANKSRGEYLRAAFKTPLGPHVNRVILFTDGLSEAQVLDLVVNTAPVPTIRFR
jgi:hypothetical protein